IQGDEISSGEGDARMDWAIGVQIGEGPVAETPAATIKLGAAEAEDIRQGRLHPLEALITGRLQLDGDLGLILQLQAVAMTLSMTAGGGVSR
ncbi:SCP2 sterol-binding domain-containing protein, partial [Myxococcota bacterium]|nr:SCP2 sterol-binding domain-containing protein [Myxococcota bacterium]